MNIIVNSGICTNYTETVSDGYRKTPYRYFVQRQLNPRKACKFTKQIGRFLNAKVELE